MRSRSIKARCFEPGFDLRGKASPPLRIHRSDPLTLPKIECLGNVQKGTPQEAAIALHWLDAGLINEAWSDRSTQQLVRIGLKNWVDAKLGETPNLAEMNLMYSVHSSDSLDTPPDPDHWFLQIDLESPMIRFLEPRFKSLEAKVPGLFRTALRAYESVVGAIAMTGTPQCIFEFAENHIFYGTTSQEDFLEEAMCCGLEEDELAEMLSPDGFKAGIPDWLFQQGVTQSKRKKDTTMLTDTKLKQLVRSEDSEISAIARCVLNLKALRESVKFVFQYAEEQEIYPLVLLRWNDQDAIGRAYDDIVETANQSMDCYTLTITQQWVDSKDAGLKKWQTDYESVFAALRLANELVGYLSEPEND